MAEYAKRPEITVSTMGKVHNPSGEGVKAISSQVQAKIVKQQQQQLTQPQHVDEHETKVKEGTAKRNIHRKKKRTVATPETSILVIRSRVGTARVNGRSN